ncbi:NlpC/P60 family protein [Microbulbifer halophilus]|uniref:NlpC/P60 family protein n=1 Tax=Microbulbifer halophilus TaxID=453963 RepID=A0ABW5EFM9_9GAMM|nr:NlpC/P60 family protein [Microbulbifer halophilus]MCW8127760.1 NlpC/P60 family protein [Microbulbifer halophilus]
MKKTTVLAGFFFAALMAACAGAAEPREPGVGEFVTDVPGIREEMFSADFWVQRLESDGLRMTAEDISAFNTANFTRGEYLHDLAELGDRLSRAEVVALLDGVSRPASSPRYHADGRRVSAADYAGLDASVQRDRIPAEVGVRWGLVVQRASMRSYPTRERIFKHPGGGDLDRLQETGVFPGQRVALLHESADGNWWFALNYHYAAWLPKSAVAVGDKDAIESWLDRGPRLTVTGAQERTNYNPVDSRTSELLLEMGVSLPLLGAGQVGHDVHGQNPYASHIVELPVREADGSLAFEPALIARSRDVHMGHLPYRPSAVLQQAFKFLGERYGWGHDYNGRDCTGFVGEVFKSFGVLMPRNSGQQGHGKFAPTRFFDEGDKEARQRALASLTVGDLLYIPGHVMMYIGRVDGESYVIHDVTGLNYFDSDNKFYSGTLSGVSVTPLSPLMLNREKSIIDSIYAVKTII